MFSSAPFGDIDGRKVTLYTLRNRNGMEVRLCDYGAIVQSLKVPDRWGKFADVVLGFDSLEAYRDDPHYVGAMCGPFANRIAHGRFSIPDGDDVCDVGTNLPPHHLHGGDSGFHKRLWDGKMIWRDGAQGLQLSLSRAHGDGGYPGQLQVEALFLLTEDNALRIDLKATTDRVTPVSLTHHGYFNLNGAGEGDILDHRLTLAATHLTPVDETLIPKGTLHPVDHTPFDFREPKAIGRDLQRPDQQLAYGSGYDHNFVLTMTPGAMRFVARLESPKSGRCMELHTTKPGLQLYAGNHIGGTVGKGGATYPRHGGLCLEPQHFPDAPNQPDFPSPFLAPGEQYRHTMLYRFLSI